jgi:hypothetical protein
VKASTRTRVAAVVATLGVVGAGAAASPATAGSAGGPAVRVLTRGLDGPYGLQATSHGGFVVAEGDTGQVTRVGRHGAQHVVISGAGGVAGVAEGGGHLFAVLGGPNEDGSPRAGRFPATSLLRSTRGGHHVQVIANLLRYELAHNPDGQVQFVKGKPVDALSNPFSMNKSRYGLLVADGGANDVLKVDPRTGRVSTFFVPPTVKDVPACLAPHAQSNPGTVGCDPVPTGIAVARGSVYVSTLGAEVPGAGRIYRLNPHTGKVREVWKNLTAPTGIAVTQSGRIFFSEVLFGAPAGDGPPPPGFNPARVGRITMISHHRMTHARVTMPTGLDYRHGRLYASSWSIAGFLHLPHRGQIVSVRLSAFH